MYSGCWGEEGRARHGGCSWVGAAKTSPVYQPSGLFCRLCKEKDTGHEVAIKLIKRPIPKPAIAVIKREIKIQADLGQGHLNIVSADEVILSRTHLGLVMEYVPGKLLVLDAPCCAA
jgi:serine/threonine protein kinase